MNLTYPFIQSVVRAVETIAPLRYADTTWDNVGLLLDSTSIPSSRPYRIAIVLDLTSEVVEECVRRQTHFLVCYHPVIFAPLRSIRTVDPKQEALLRAAREGIAIYSPHTALDNAPGGINEWIAHGIAAALPESSSKPVYEPIVVEPSQGMLLTLPQEHTGYTNKLSKKKISLHAVILAVKRHFGIQNIRLCLAPKHSLESSVRKIGICAGSGYSVLQAVAGKATCVITGEMSHHNMLTMQQQGTTVVLVEHGTSERGYLKDVFRAKLEQEMTKSGNQGPTIKNMSGHLACEVYCPETDQEIVRLV